MDAPSLLSVFQTPRGISKPLLLLYFSINGLLFLNIFLHAPEINYDGVEHLRYIETLAQGHLPNLEDSKEFFSPPLPYLLPAFIRSFGPAGMWAATKLGQLLNLFLSLGLTWNLLRLGDCIRPNDNNLKLAALSILGLMPVYYKTFVMIRGEPFVAYLATLIAVQTLALFPPPRDTAIAAPTSKPASDIFSLSPTFWKSIRLGLSLGLIALSRQWGFFLFPATALFVFWVQTKLNPQNWLKTLGLLALSFFMAFLVGGWFYLSLFGRYGTVTAFNRNPSQQFSLTNQPVEFYFGLGLDDLFTHPVRDAFPNQFIPMFYSDFWGDYWAYFLIVGRDSRTHRLIPGAELAVRWSQNPPPKWFVTNKTEMTAYLGRVNLVSIPLTLLLLGGLSFGLFNLLQFARLKTSNHPQANALAVNVLMTSIILCSLAGYFWFLIRYPLTTTIKGDTIKASYMLHIYPFLALLTGWGLQTLRARWPKSVPILTGLVLITVIHNLPAMLTRYIPWNVLAYYLPFQWLIVHLPWY